MNGDTVLAFNYGGPDARCRIGARELHCGDCFQLSVNGGQWKDVRIEFSQDWYLIGVTPSAALNWQDTIARF